MGKCTLDFKNIAKKKWLPYVCLVILFLCVIVRFFTGPVVGFGNNSNFILSNDFWNFAKSILQGKVLYKDLIDHKGLYLYVPYMILYLVSDGWFGIIQIAETIAYIFTLLAFWKMSCLLLEENTKENKIFSLFITTLFAIVFLFESKWVCLINVEGLATIAMLLIYGYISKKKKASPIFFFLIGLVLGYLFNIKLTIVAPFFPLFLFACVLHFKNNGTKRTFLLSVVSGILGFVVVNIPFAIYLAITNSFEDMISIYKIAFSKSNDLKYDIALASIVSIFLFVYCYYKGKEYFSRFFLFLSIFGIALFFGKIMGYYAIFYTTAIFMGLFWDKKANIALIFMASIIFLYFGIVNFKCETLFKNDATTKEIATNLSITNDNILYLWEDAGFGNYSEEPFRIPYQWLPDTFLYSEGFQDFYCNKMKSLIKNKEFKYVYAPPKEVVDGFEEAYLAQDKDGLDVRLWGYVKLYGMVSPILEENYTPSEEYPFVYIVNE